MSDRPCRACRAPLSFASAPTGKTLPLQHVRNVYTVELDADGVAIAKPLPPGRYFVSHYETCTDPRRFSRAGQEGGS